jgi:hypothetical protein
MALISKHTLTPYQQVDTLVNMEPLWGRKPSDMLAEMEKFKPQDMQSFYAYHYLQRLLREIRVLLAQDDLSNMTVLAEKADQLVALHQLQHHNTVAVVTLPEQQAAIDMAKEDPMAAVVGKKDKLNNCSYQWKFLRAEVRFPNLGIDFLKHFDLLVSSS